MENSGREGTELKEGHRSGKLFSETMPEAITPLSSFLDTHPSL